MLFYYALLWPSCLRLIFRPYDLIEYTSLFHRLCCILSNPRSVNYRPALLHCLLPSRCFFVEALLLPVFRPVAFPAPRLSADNCPQSICSPNQFGINFGNFFSTALVWPGRSKNRTLCLVIVPASQCTWPR